MTIVGLLVLVDDSLLDFAGLQIGVTDKQRNLVVFVQVVPQLLGESIDVGGNFHTLRLTLEGGDDGIAVADVGVQEMAQTGGGGILPEIAGAGVA